MQIINDKTLNSLKIQNQAVFTANSINNGCSVTSPSMIPKNNLYIKKRFHICSYNKSFIKATHPRNNALSLV